MLASLKLPFYSSGRLTIIIVFLHVIVTAGTKLQDCSLDLNLAVSGRDPATRGRPTQFYSALCSSLHSKFLYEIPTLRVDVICY